ncbi:MAG: hypothetical protein K2P77_03475 [Burkholderiaceae bacterium]|nr:hypothetical protein [Burkholderiaceae bacterium]
MHTLPDLSSPAQQSAASHRADLLLMACRYALPPADASPSAQSAWHAQRQADFLAWLTEGGFAQTSSAIENSGIAPLSSTPAGAV